MLKIADLKDSIKRTFEDFEIMKYDEVFEEYSDGFKYVIFFHRLYHNNDAFLYSKFIFYLNRDKETLKKSYFKYLYDLNCSFRLVSFNDFSDMKEKILEIFNHNDFGSGLRSLSKLVRNPITDMNDWFARNDINDITIESFKYEPKVTVVPCVSISFPFSIEIGGNKIDLLIKKDDDKTYKLNFYIFDEEIEIEKTDISTIIQTLCETLKEKIK